MCKVTTFNLLVKAGKERLHSASNMNQLQQGKKEGQEMKAVLRAVVTAGRGRAKELVARCRKFEVKVDAFKTAVAEQGANEPGPSSRQAKAKAVARKKVNDNALPPICQFDVGACDDESHKLQVLSMEDIAGRPSRNRIRTYFKQNHFKNTLKLF